MRRRLGRILLVVYLVTAVVHVPFVVGLAFALSTVGVGPAWPIALAAGLTLLALLRGRIDRARSDAPLGAWKLGFVEAYFVHWCAAVVSAPLCLLALGANGAAHLLAAAPISVGLCALAAYAAGIAIAGWGVFVRRHWVRVREIDVPIAGLGASFDGYRIAQLSDLHIGSLWPRHRAARWSARVNRLDADLVALTGDYVTNGTAFHDDIAHVLASMRARDGAIAVMGNHDYFGSDGEPLTSLLAARGVTLLRNAHTTLVRGADRLVVAGVDDTWSRRADVGRALAGRDERHPVIALAHDPMLFPELARLGAALVLSGHTHWGQIALPFFPTRVNLSQLSYRYHAGIYRDGDATLYVHPGLGTTGPPVRVGAAPEITVLCLRSVPTPA